jgi:hypothetical protein
MRRRFSPELPATPSPEVRIQSGEPDLICGLEGQILRAQPGFLHRSIRKSVKGFTVH